MRTSTRTALAYGFTALVWIYLTDWLVLWLGVPAATAQLVKGTGFVLVTAAVLWLTLRRSERVQGRMSARLEERERQYRELFDANPQPMWVYDVVNLRFLAVNDAAVDKYGYSHEEFLGMVVGDIESDGNSEMPGDGASNGEAAVQAATQRHRTKDGTLLCVSVSSHATHFGGRAAEVVLADDVTARLQAEKAVLAAKRDLEAIIETSPLAIIQLDSDGRVLRWNGSAERIFGWSEREVLGQFSPIVPEDAEDAFRERLARVLGGSRLEGERVKRRRKDGTVLDAMLYTAPVSGSSSAGESALALLVDITSQVESESELKRYREKLEELVQERTTELNRLNERLRMATQVKSEFLANMSHELRTPLNSIIGFSGAMLQGLAGDVSEEQLKQLGMVYRSGKHLLDIINDILDLSKIEAGHMSVEVQKFGVNELVESVVETLRPEADARSIGMELAVDPSPKPAETDRTKVRQILLNLVGNAVKFTDQGGVEVRVHTSGPMLRVEVEDTGPGIPDDERTLIFDEFTQSKRRADEKPQGTGLGLAISRRLARMMGGEIHVDSVVGTGSTFTLILPRVYVGDRESMISGFEGTQSPGGG